MLLSHEPTRTILESGRTAKLESGWKEEIHKESMYTCYVVCSSCIIIFYYNYKCLSPKQQQQQQQSVKGLTRLDIEALLSICQESDNWYTFSVLSVSVISMTRSLDLHLTNHVMPRKRACYHVTASLQTQHQRMSSGVDGSNGGGSNDSLFVNFLQLVFFEYKTYTVTHTHTLYSV